MTPVKPAIADGVESVIFAKDQPPYAPLPATVDLDGIVTTEWEPTTEELDCLFCGGRVRLRMHTFGAPLQPMMLDVVLPDVVRES